MWIYKILCKIFSQAFQTERYLSAFSSAALSLSSCLAKTSFSLWLSSLKNSNTSLSLDLFLPCSLPGLLGEQLDDEEEARVVTVPPDVEVRLDATTRGGLIECCPWSAASITLYYCQLAAVTPPASTPLPFGGSLSSWKIISTWKWHENQI